MATECASLHLQLFCLMNYYELDSFKYSPYLCAQYTFYEW